MTKQQQIIILREAGYSYVDIAAQLNTSESYCRDTCHGKNTNAIGYAVHRCPHCRAMINTRHCIACELRGVA